MEELKYLREKLLGQTDKQDSINNGMPSSEFLTLKNEGDLKYQEYMKKIKILEESIKDLSQTIKDKNEIVSAKSAIIQEKNSVIQMNEILIQENEELIMNNSEKISLLDDEIIEKDNMIISLQIEIEQIKKGCEKVIQ